MQRFEYNTKILPNGKIPLPEEIRKRALLKPSDEIKVQIEVLKQDKMSKKEYSFAKVRKLLRDIKGDMSSDIISDREYRV